MKFDVSHDILDLISKMINLAESCKQDLRPRPMCVKTNGWGEIKKTNLKKKELNFNLFHC